MNLKKLCTKNVKQTEPDDPAWPLMTVLAAGPGDKTAWQSVNLHEVIFPLQSKKHYALQFHR